MTELRLEIGREPRTQVCSDCGGVSRTTQGFIYRDGDAFAVYFSTLYEHTHGARAQLAIGIGAWENASAAFSAFLDVTSTDDQIQFGFTDPEHSSWAQSKLLIHHLTADEARRHPTHGDFLAIAETIVRNDPAVASHVSRG